MRILLADDHTLFRAGIRSILERVQGVTVVAEASDGRKALDLLEEHRPDIALLDISMPGLNGLEVANRVKSVSPGTKVIILSMHASEGYVAQALRAGVNGYILKDAASKDLELSLRAVARGETWLSPSISKQVVELFLRGDKPADDPLSLLTARQREILQLIAEGKSTKEIAYDLEVSVKTVEAHRAQLMERLDIHDIPGLVRFAIRTGLVSPEA